MTTFRVNIVQKPWWLNKAGRKSDRVKILAWITIVTLVAAMGTPAAAATIYTWTDDSGVVHITDSPPPDHAKIENRLDYQPAPKSVEAHPDRIDKLQPTHEEKEAAEKEAQHKRRQADEAVQAARQATEQAKAARAEADVYYEKVGPKSRKVKSLRFKIKAYEERAVEAEKQAEELRKRAALAEAEAQAAFEQLEILDQQPLD
jgi:uncharacterized protein (DUF3084 family)